MSCVIAGIVNKVCPAPYVHACKYQTSWTWANSNAGFPTRQIATIQNRMSEATKQTEHQTHLRRCATSYSGAFAEKAQRRWCRQLQEKSFYGSRENCLEETRAMKKNPETKPDGKAGQALKTGVLWDFL